MVSGRLARSRKSGPGGQEVVNEKFEMELNRKMDCRRSGHVGPEVVNEKLDKELNREMDGSR